MSLLSASRDIRYSLNMSNVQVRKPALSTTCSATSMLRSSLRMRINHVYVYIQFYSKNVLKYNYLSAKVEPINNCRSWNTSFIFSIFLPWMFQHEKSCNNSANSCYIKMTFIKPRIFHSTSIGIALHTYTFLMHILYGMSFSTLVP